MQLSAVPVDSPPMTLRPFHGPQTTIQAMIDAVKGPRGERSAAVRSCAEHIVRELQPKDYLSEILAIRYFVNERCRFTNDALQTEWVKDPERIVTEISKYGTATIDCDEVAMLIVALARCLGREGDFVTVGFGRPNSFSHVFARVHCPKPNGILVLDPVAGTDERSMLNRIRTSRIWKLN